MLDDLAAAYVSNAIVQSAWLPTVKAQANLVNQKPAQALELLEPVKPYERGQHSGNLSDSCMKRVYLRGEAYLATKQARKRWRNFRN